MNKFAVAFAATSLMALAACGETPSAENNVASNEVMNDVDAMNSANMMDNSANMMANDMGNNVVENAAANEAGAM